MSPAVTPVFVVGYMHSGTTLVRNVLARSPSVFAAGETKYFDLRRYVLRRYADLADPAVREAYLRFAVDLIEGRDRLEVYLRPDYEPAAPAERVRALLAPEPSPDAGHDALFIQVFAGLARAAGRAVWVEKTPSNVNHVDRILAVAPGARFVEIVRDPRDIVASKKTRRQNALTGDRYKEEVRAMKRLANAYDPLWDTLGWKAAIRAGRRAAADHPGRVHRVRYEDLVERPEETVRVLCGFVGLEYDPAFLRVGFRNTADRGRPRAKSGGPISRASVGRWREHLEPSEAAVCQWVAGREAVELGYAPDPVPAGVRVRAGGRLLRSGGDLGARVFRRWRLGGRAFARVVLESYAGRLRYLRRRS